MFNNFFFFNSYSLRDNVERYCRSGQATEDNITRRIHIACWLPKAANTQAEYIKRTVFFKYDNSYINGRQCCGIRALPVLFVFILREHFIINNNFFISQNSIF